MPGSQSRHGERSEVIVLRVTPSEKRAWLEHVDGKGYLSSLVRELVEAHLAAARGKARCAHWG